jgi:hypothetical protein
MADGRFVLEEVAPGFTADEVLSLTEMDCVAAAHVGTIAVGQGEEQP